jgi:hypothetical protein
MGYYNTKTGSFDKDKQEDELQTLQIREKYGMAVLNDKAVAYIGPTMPKNIRGHSMRWDLKTGDKEFTASFNLNLVIADTITVYKNGGESLVMGQDYTIDYTHNRIILTHPAKGTDDDLEIRCQIDVTNQHIKTNVLLLPRQTGSFEFTNEQLEDLLPVYGDRLSVERLLQYRNAEALGTTSVEYYKNKKETVFVVQSAEITEEGIMGIGIIQ